MDNEDIIGLILSLNNAMWEQPTPQFTLKDVKEALSALKKGGVISQDDVGVIYDYFKISDEWTNIDKVIASAILDSLPILREDAKIQFTVRLTGAEIQKDCDLIKDLVSKHPNSKTLQEVKKVLERSNNE